MKTTMMKFSAQKLTKEQMKGIVGGNVDPDECNAIVYCDDGTMVNGYFSCEDFDGGGDGELICQAGGYGSSVSCDCLD